MSDEKKPASRRLGWGRHLAFLILLVVGLVAAIVQYRFLDTMFLKVSVMGYPPPPLRMAWIGSFALFVLPGFTLILWVVSGRVNWAAGPVSLSLQGTSLVITHLLVAYLALVPAALLGFWPDNRLSWDARSIFERAIQVKVLALDPGVELAPSRSATETNFHGYEITGSVVVTDPAQVTNIVHAVFRSVDEAWLPGAICFRPHHGLIVVTPKTEMHLVICYECDRVNVYAKDQVQQGIITSRSKPILDTVLGPLAPKPESP